MTASSSSKRPRTRFAASVIAAAVVALIALALPLAASADGTGSPPWIDNFSTTRRVSTLTGTKISGGLKLAEQAPQLPGDDLGEAVPGERVILSMVAVGTDVFTGTGEKGHLVRYSAGEFYQEAFQGPSHKGVSNSRGQAIGGAETRVTALAYDGTRYVYGGTGGTGSEGHVFSYDTSDPGKMCVDRGTPERDSPITSIAFFGGLVYAGTGSGHVYSYAGGLAFTDLGQPSGSSKTLAMAVVGGQLCLGLDNGKVFNGGTFTEINSPGLGSAVNAFASDGTVLYTGTADGALHSYDTAAPGPFVSGGSPGGGVKIESLAVRSGVVFAGMDDGHVWSYSDTRLPEWVDEGIAPNGGVTPTSVNALVVSSDNVLYGGTGDTSSPSALSSTGRLFRRAVDVYEDHGGPVGPPAAVTGVAIGSKKLYFSKGENLYTYDSPDPDHYTDYGAPEPGQAVKDIDYLATGNQGVVCLGLANGDIWSFHEEGSTFHRDWQWGPAAAINSLNHDSSTIYAGLSDGRLMNAMTGNALGTTEGAAAINDLAYKSSVGGADVGEYAGAADGKLYHLNGSTFQPVEVDPPEDISAVNAVAVYGDDVFIGHQSGKIYKWDGISATLAGDCTHPVISMATGAQGVVVGTSGNNHTYIYDTTISDTKLRDQGAVPDGTSPRALCNVNSSIWIGTAGGRLYAHDSSNLGDRGQQVRKQIMIWCITYDPVRDQYYAGTYQNAHFLIIKPSGEVRDCGRPIDGERELEDILVTSGGTVYGATYGGTEELHNPDGGHLFTFDPDPAPDPAAMSFTDKGRPPSDDNNWWVSSLVEAPANSNHVFGATCNSAADHTGSLFTYDGATFTNLGNIDTLNGTPGPPLADEGPRCLTYYDFGTGAKVYGGTHNPTDTTKSHVFSCAANGTGFTSQSLPDTTNDNAINRIKPSGSTLYCARNDGYAFPVDPATLSIGTPFQPVASGTTVLGLATRTDGSLLFGTGQRSPNPGGHLASYDPSLQQSREIDVSAIANNQAVVCLAIGSTGVTFCGTKGNDIPGGWNAGKLFKVEPYSKDPPGTAVSTVIDPAVTELPQPFDGQGISALCAAPSGRQEVYAGTADSGGTAKLYRYTVATDAVVEYALPDGGLNQDRILSLAPGPDGKVYIGTGSATVAGRLMRFDPGTQVISDLGAPEPGAKGIFAITTGPDGKIYLGTGDNGGQGQVFTYDGTSFAAPTNSFGPTPGRITSLVNYGGKVYGVTSAEPGNTGAATFFRISSHWDSAILGGTESSAVSLVVGPGGGLFCGTGPTGKLVQITINGSNPPTFQEKPGWPGTLTGKGVTALAGTPDAIYGCAGPQGNLFKWTTGGFIDKGPLTIDNAGVPSAVTDNLGKPYFGTAGSGTPVTGVELVRYNPTAAFVWGDFSATSTSHPPTTNATFDVLKEDGTEAVHDATPLPYTISSLTERALKLRANLSTTDPLQTPTVTDWQVTWSKQASVDRFEYQHAEGVYRGEQFAIWGADFGPTTSGGTVMFPGGPPVSADFWDPNRIIVTVPQSATTGSVVITPNGGDPRASDSKTFNLLSEPHVTSVSPNAGRVGDVVSVHGSGFLAARGSDDSVTFNGVAAAGYTSWSDTLIKAQVPAGAATGNLVVSVNTHASNQVPFTVQVGGGPTVRVTDPSSGAAVKGAVIVNATVQKQGGTAPVELWVDGKKSASDAGAPYSFNWNSDAVPDGAHTLTVKATDGFGRSGSASIVVYVDHNVPSANTNWYFAEGCTNYGFETWLLIGNPTGVAAKAQVVFMDDAGRKFYKTCDLPPDSRTTVNAADVAPGANVSIQVEADRPVVCERAMYWDNRVEGHDTIGTTSLSTQWYFAEGSSDWGFETYVLLCNPSDSKVKATVNYLFPDGTSAAREHDIGPHSRVTVNAVGDVGARDFSIKVDASSPGIVAERSMYHGSCGTGTIGCKAPSLTWFLSEGSTDWGFETWLLIQNPGPKAGRVTASYRKGNGETVQRTYQVKGNSRYTVNLADEVGVADVSTQVTSDVPVVCERSMYWNNRTAGHCTIGSPGPGTTWYLAEGCTDYGFETWLLLDNPSDSAVNATLTLMKENGTDVPVGVELKAHSRTSIDASRYVGAASFSTSITATSPIMVERAMYWNARSGGTDSVGAR